MMKQWPLVRSVSRQQYKVFIGRVLADNLTTPLVSETPLVIALTLLAGYTKKPVEARYSEPAQLCHLLQLLIIPCRNFPSL
jgi:hypothetical protein